MIEYRVSFRYARAVLNLATQEGIAEEVLSDFQYISESIKQSKDLRAFINSPVILHLKKKKIINEVFQSKINKLTHAFVLLLTEKGREGLLVSIAYQFKVQYNLQFGRLPVQITSANELPENVKIDITDKISKWTNKVVLSDFTVNKTIIGGLQLKIDDWVFDSSVRNQLNLLHKQLIEKKSLN
jgi:F-type H+-transporting ATPase subunit delta